MSLPGVTHAFSTREGGVSKGPWASLNLGRPYGPGPTDDGEAVEENRRRFAAAADYRPERLVEVSQVHGARCVRVTASDGAGPESSATEADALWTTEAGVPLGIRTADCAPVLIAAYAGETPIAVAAVHAGWRGACGGVVPETVRALIKDSPSAILKVAIGPTIGSEKFEVGDEVIAAAAASIGRPPRFSPGPRGRPLLDLPDLIRRQLLDAGVQGGNIDLLKHCTFSEADRFFSHRRDAGRTGRHLSVIQIEV